MPIRCLAAALIGLFLTGLAGSAAACPNPAMGAFSQMTANGAALRLGESRRINAGGTMALAGCDMGLSETPSDLFHSVPSLTADLNGMMGLAMEISVVSRCATSLLVYTSDNRWFYNADGQGPGRPRLLLSQPPTGVMSIWVGTPDGQACTARIALHTMSG